MRACVRRGKRPGAPCTCARAGGGPFWHTALLRYGSTYVCYFRSLNRLRGCGHGAAARAAAPEGARAARALCNTSVLSARGSGARAGPPAVRSAMTTEVPPLAALATQAARIADTAAAAAALSEALGRSSGARTGALLRAGAPWVVARVACALLAATPGVLEGARGVGAMRALVAALATAAVAAAAACGGGRAAALALAPAAALAAAIDAASREMFAARAALAATAIAAACYVDASRRLPGLPLRCFATHLGIAAAQTLLLWPVLAILVAGALLLVVEIDEGLGLPDEWLGPLIYWGVLYGPLGAAYVLCRLRVARDRATRAHAELLPTARPGRTA